LGGLDGRDGLGILRRVGLVLVGGGQRGGGERERRRLVVVGGRDGLGFGGGWGFRVPVVCSGGAATMSDAASPWLAGELGVLSGGA